MRVDTGSGLPMGSMGGGGPSVMDIGRMMLGEEGMGGGSRSRSGRAASGCSTSTPNSADAVQEGVKAL